MVSIGVLRTQSEFNNLNFVVKILLGRALTLEKLKDYRLSYEIFQRALKLDENGQCRNDIVSGLQRVVLFANPNMFCPNISYFSYYPNEANQQPNQYPAQMWQYGQEILIKEFFGNNNRV